MGRLTKEQKLRRAIDDLRELVAADPSVDVTYSITFKAGSKPKEKPKPRPEDDPDYGTF